LPNNSVTTPSVNSLQGVYSLLTYMNSSCFWMFPFL